LKETEDFICAGREICRDLDKNWEELVEEREVPAGTRYQNGGNFCMTAETF